MEIQRFLLVGVVMLYIQSGECILYETNNQTRSACYGTSISLSCEPGSVIAIGNIKVGAQKSSSGCRVSWTNDSNTACCEQSTTPLDDCIFGLDSETSQPYYDDCNGRRECSRQAHNVELAAERCGNANLLQYPVTTHYMFIQYHCVQDSRIESMCSSSVVAKTVKEATVYLWSAGFPISNIPSRSLSCGCSVESDNCDASIQVVFIQRELTGNSEGSCDQLLLLTDQTGTEISRWDCSNNTISLETINSSSNFITYALQNSRIVDDGNFWVGFHVEAPDVANLTVTCPAKSPTVCITTSTVTTIISTTTTTTSNVAIETSHASKTTNTASTITPTSLTTASLSKSNTNKDSDTIMIIIVVSVVVGVVLLVLITVLVVCWCCRRSDKKKREDVILDDKSTELTSVTSNQDQKQTTYVLDDERYAKITSVTSNEDEKQIKEE